MKCKPGDLAQIVKKMPIEKIGTGAVGTLDLLGTIVKVTYLVQIQDNVWCIENPLDASVVIDGQTHNFRIFGIGDDYLVPLPALPVDEEITDEVTA